MDSTTPDTILLAAACPAAPLPGGGKQPEPEDSYDTKSGLITPSLSSGFDVRVVTTETAPGRNCTALSGTEA